MSPQTPAGGSDPSVLPPAGLPTEEHWRLAADAVTGHLLEVDQVRAVAEAIAAAEHRGGSTLPIDAELAYQLADDAIGLFLEYRDQHGRDEAHARTAAAGDVAEGASIELPPDLPEGMTW